MSSRSLGAVAIAGFVSRHTANDGQISNAFVEGAGSQLSQTSQLLPERRARAPVGHDSATRQLGGGLFIDGVG